MEVANTEVGTGVRLLLNVSVKVSDGVGNDLRHGGISRSF